MTLFGRTLAGKSTIREAITGGDGSTMGKGAQRTTRDVREYDWNALRIVDTPSIGALEDFLHTQAKCIQDSGVYLKAKFGELDVWLDGYIGTVNQRIEHEAEVFFRPLRASVSSFVDDNLESADVDARWARRVEQLGIDTWASDLCQQLHEEVRAQLAEFNREIEVDSQLTGALHITGPGHGDLWDVRRMLRWGSALCSAFAGVAALLGESNFWNPIGWIAAGAGLAFIGLSWFFDDRQSRIKRQKNRGASQLREQIADMEH